jgi:Peptidase MA superfamily
MKGWMAVTCILLVLLAASANAMSLGEKTKHFDLYYADASQLDRKSGTGQALENAYGSINGYLDTCPDHIKVLVVGKKTMDQVGEHVEAFSAWNNKSSAIVLREESLKDEKALTVVAKHEICHLGINNILAGKNSKDFAWMEEGVCMVLSQEPFSDAKVSKYILSKGFMGPKEIASAVDNENYNVSKNGYMQSYSLIRYMAERYGADAVVDILKSKETDFERAFMRTTGSDFATFYTQWQAHVRSAASGSQAPAGWSFYPYMRNDMDLSEFLA